MNSTPKIIYLNNAAGSWPKAPGVVEAVAKTLGRHPEPQGRSAGEAESVAEECRKRLAQLLKVEDPGRIAITASATHALNMAILGLALKPGDRVITTVAEHNSVLRPLNSLHDRKDIKIDIVGIDSRGSLDNSTYERALEKKPKLVVINHVSNVTGRINQVSGLFEKAKAAGATTLLDASQSLGHIDVNPGSLNADILAFTGHKALHGPPGIGGLYVHPGIELDQYFVGGTGTRSDLRLHPSDMPSRLEAGTLNTPAVAGLTAALTWFEKNHREHLQKCSSAASLLRKGLKDIPAIKIFDNNDSESHIGIISFRINGLDVEECGFVLRKSFSILSRTGLHCAPLIHDAMGSAPEGTIRFSVSGFTTEEDISLALSAIRTLAK